MAEHRREDVCEHHRCFDALRCRPTRAGNDQGDFQAAFELGEFAASQGAVVRGAGIRRTAVVAGEDDEGVVEQSLGIQVADQFADRPVQPLDHGEVDALVVIGRAVHGEEVFTPRLKRRMRRAERHVGEEWSSLDPGSGDETLGLFNDGVGQIACLTNGLPVASDGRRSASAHVPDVFLPEERMMMLDDAGPACVCVKGEGFHEPVLLLEAELQRVVFRAVA